MKIVEVGSRNKSKTRHYIDVDKYKRLSRAKALCGCLGTKLIQYNAVYFNYKIIYPKMCKKCAKIYKERQEYERKVENKNIQERKRAKIVWEAKRRLTRYLELNYPCITLNALEISNTKGCWRVKVNCLDGNNCKYIINGKLRTCRGIKSIISFIEYDRRDENGKFESPYTVWNILKNNG
jgi:hypothetical protein